MTSSLASRSTFTELRMTVLTRTAKHAACVFPLLDGALPPSRWPGAQPLGWFRGFNQHNETIPTEDLRELARGRYNGSRGIPVHGNGYAYDDGGEFRLYLHRSGALLISVSFHTGFDLNDQATYQTFDHVLGAAELPLMTLDERPSSQRREPLVAPMTGESLQAELVRRLELAVAQAPAALEAERARVRARAKEDEARLATLERALERAGKTGARKLLGLAAPASVR